MLTPSVEVWSNASAVTPVAFSVALAVVSPAGAVVATASGAGAAPGGGAVTTWAPAAPLALPGAALWHLVDAPLKPALYTLVTTLSVGGAVVQAHNTTFGVRATRWSADTGFWLNGVNTKIKGTANHQDYMAIGVAVPDHIQAQCVYCARCCARLLALGPLADNQPYARPTTLNQQPRVQAQGDGR